MKTLKIAIVFIAATFLVGCIDQNEDVFENLPNDSYQSNSTGVDIEDEEPQGTD